MLFRLWLIINPVCILKEKISIQTLSNCMHKSNSSYFFSRRGSRFIVKFIALSNALHIAFFIVLSTRLRGKFSRFIARLSPDERLFPCHRRVIIIDQWPHSRSRDYVHSFTRVITDNNEPYIGQLKVSGYIMVLKWRCGRVW